MTAGGSEVIRIVSEVVSANQIFKSPLECVHTSSPDSPVAVIGVPISIIVDAVVTCLSGVGPLVVLQIWVAGIASSVADLCHPHTLSTLI